MHTPSIPLSCLLPTQPLALLSPAELNQLGRIIVSSVSRSLLLPDASRGAGAEVNAAVQMLEQSRLQLANAEQERQDREKIARTAARSAARSTVNALLPLLREVPEGTLERLRVSAWRCLCRPRRLTTV